MRVGGVLQDLQQGMPRNGFNAINQTGRGQARVLHMTGWITRHFSIFGTNTVSLH
ncbi:hypothetical protein BLA13014_00824 [Burkholderia aenigmatica]|uniref:Uncharacterized protein n=1 Tax=Burkholderia aenigmatica TaxID=2015348 RepID=A0A6P2I1R9_9BURK|nr:hypothetical protein BLA13014_00824 [Burkholderia aenigmatica]